MRRRLIQLLVDPAGVIIDVWVGQLGDEQETAVLEALFGE